jgi:hypothetical protein
MQLGAVWKLQSISHRVQFLDNLEGTKVFGTQFAVAYHLKRSNGSMKKAKPSPLIDLKLLFTMMAIIMQFVAGLCLFQTITHFL